jgi:glycosyltransferase involved in cell wall biosynthesis
MQPLVSVRVATYNHEKYIAQCIEGILMQKTDYPFEVIIGEDCSTDRTRQIVLSYQEKYPEKVRALLSPQNLGPARNSLQIYQACRGKYHAMCEGDDYWIDPLKLQKQVNIMEAHPEVSLCFHNAIVFNEPATATRLFIETPLKESLDFADACQLGTPTASVMARSEILATLPEWRLKIWCGDVLFRLWCAHHGTLHYLNEIMSVYRVHSGSLTAKQGERRKKAYEEQVFLYEQLDRETHFQHTAVLKAKIRQVDQFYQRKQNHTVYYLTHPSSIYARLQVYYRVVKNYYSTL